MKTKLIGLIVGLTLGVALATLSYHSAIAATCVFSTETDCDKGGALSSWSRNQAASYSWSAINEPYSTLGGWWIDNDTKDPQDPVKGNEGMDCSGLVFKSWAMRYTRGQTGFQSWQKSHDVHGPYQAKHFRHGSGTSTNDCSGACRKICGDTTHACGAGHSLVGMDVYSSVDHVAIFVRKNSQGNDVIREAHSPVAWERTTNVYRDTVGYEGVRRNSW